MYNPPIGTNFVFKAAGEILPAVLRIIKRFSMLTARQRAPQFLGSRNVNNAIWKMQRTIGPDSSSISQRFGSSGFLRYPNGGAPRCSPLIAVCLGQPKAKLTFRNRKGKPPSSVSSVSLHRSEYFNQVSCKSVFEIAVIGVDRNPRTCFIKEYSVVFCYFLSPVFITSPSFQKIAYFFFVIARGAFLTKFEHCSKFREYYLI